MAATVRTTAARFLPSADVEDLVQDVMLELWVKADRFDSSAGTPCGWATTIARRRSIDRLRSEVARTRREEQVGRLRDVRADIHLVSEEVVVRLDRDRLFDALDVLKPAQREAIALAFFGHRSYAEVARTLGLPEGTVKRRIRDGMKRLRVKLSDVA